MCNKVGSLKGRLLLSRLFAIVKAFAYLKNNVSGSPQRHTIFHGVGSKLFQWVRRYLAFHFYPKDRGDLKHHPHSMCGGVRGSRKTLEV